MRSYLTLMPQFCPMYSHVHYTQDMDMILISFIKFVSQFTFHAGVNFPSEL